MMTSSLFLRKAATSLAQTSRRHLAAVSCAAVKSPRECLLDIPETKITTLSNGFNVASENSGTPSCTIGVWIEAGSRHEDPSKNGVSNLLEHVLFKGTNKRSGSDLEKELRKIGAQVGMYTGREHTAVYARCQTKDAGKAAELLADVVLNCGVSKESLEKEKGVILNQMKEAEQDHRETVMNLLHKAAFQNTPLAQSVLGPVDILMNLDVKDLEEYMEDNFKAPRMCLVGAGGVEHGALVELGEKFFGNVSNTYPRKIPEYDHPCRFTGSEIHYDDYSIPDAYGAVAVEGVGFNHPDRIPLEVATAIMGQWKFNKSFGPHSPHVVAQKLGWHCDHQSKCLEYEAFNICYKNDGLFGVYHKSEEEGAYTAVYTFLQHWKHLCMKVSDEEVLMGKNLLKTQMGKKHADSFPQ